MEFKKVHISDLKPAEYNPRKDLKPNDPEYQRIKRSMEEFGYVDPIIINKDFTVIGGHQRLKVLQEQGETVIDVVVVDIPKTKEKALNVALNKITGDWDFQQLSIVLSELKEENFDIEITGFSDKELKEIDAELFGKQAKEDDYEPPPEIKTDIKRGDIYQLGRHRVMCGDSTSKEDVGKLMDGKKADMVFTDPPYNVASEGRNYAADAPTQMKTYKTLKDADWDKDFDIKTIFPVLYDVLKEDCAVYVCTSHWLIQGVWEWMWSWSKFCSYNVWCKPNPAPSLAKRHWSWATELVAYAVRGKHVANFPAEGHALNWWQIVSPTHTTGHPTEKPIAVPTKAIEFSSRKDMLIFDGFLGSGTTLIACEQLGRICYGMEISPQYCEVICQRFEKLTNVKRQKVK